MICEISDASKYIINAIRTGDLGVAGTSNLYGEEQLALDVLSDRIIQKRMEFSGVVANMVSEETPEIVSVKEPSNRRYSVLFDPLDGSSLVDVNLAVGTIVSIYEGNLSCSRAVIRLPPCIFFMGREQRWFCHMVTVCMNLL